MKNHLFGQHVFFLPSWVPPSEPVCQGTGVGVVRHTGGGTFPFAGPTSKKTRGVTPPISPKFLKTFLERKQQLYPPAMDIHKLHLFRGLDTPKFNSLIVRPWKVTETLKRNEFSNQNFTGLKNLPFAMGFGVQRWVTSPALFWVESMIPVGYVVIRIQWRVYTVKCPTTALWERAKGTRNKIDPLGMSRVESMSIAKVTIIKLYGSTKCIQMPYEISLDFFLCRYSIVKVIRFNLAIFESNFMFT